MAACQTQRQRQDKPGRSALLVAVGLAVCWSAIPAMQQPAWAGADDLFGDGQGHPPQFIGIVRDIKSFKPIVGARVFATVKGGQGAGVTTYSDAEGRFRIEGFAEDTNRDTVVIECTKPGFKVVNTIRRKISPDPQAPIEIECLQEPG